MSGPFRYDHSDIHLVYDSTREMLSTTRAVWRKHLEASVGLLEPRRVLDLGCGTGRYTRLVHEAFPRAMQIVGLDPARSMLGEAAAVSGAALPLLVRGVGEHLPFRDQHFDLVVVSMVFHHLVEPGLTLSEVRRVLQRSGLAYVRTPTRESLRSCFWLECFPRAQEIAEETVPSRRRVREQVAAEGLNLEEHESVRSAFASRPEDCVSKIAGRGISCLRQIPVSEFEAGLRTLKVRCRDLPGDFVIEEDIDVFVLRPS